MEQGSRSKTYANKLEIKEITNAQEILKCLLAIPILTALGLLVAEKIAVRIGIANTLGFLEYQFFDS